ncbi:MULTISPECIES: tetratricopeptide repeat protein [Prauserella salsuginis group]|uniref:tetratricopeptide repeat protein n=1 Tax=Prauserella salsuginis group TaxID=2893672 RepID=UPI002164B791|nr:MULTISPECIES: tetratricopeptide repeat protein [Prauserella salsuginis group]
MPREPDLPDEAEYSMLDAEAKRELRALPKDFAERIGRHLVAAGMLLDTDPDAALSHARYAKKRASRFPVAREALGLAAYHTGNWSEALSELRAVRRMTHTDAHIAVIADSERAMGRPERAIDIAKETDLAGLPKETAVELKIVEAGARRDLGQLDAAVVTLQGSDLDPQRPQPWSVRLFYAYADNLAAAGRTAEAVQWFLRAAEVDDDMQTDAAERASELADE